VNPFCCGIAGRQIALLRAVTDEQPSVILFESLDLQIVLSAGLV
jgi:hypothetical protein